MSDLQKLIENNHLWATQMKAENPEFFRELAHQQTPAYLWIGCSDSRVTPDRLVNTSPGQMFVHRNVANVVVHTDLNCLSVMQYAVEVLKVKHIIVCGHYNCGGVHAALTNSKYGLIDNWLRHVQDVKQKHAVLLAGYTPQEQLRRLCELNVIEQVVNACETTIVQQAWERHQDLTVHGWVYGLEDGLIRDLKISAAGQEDLDVAHRLALTAYAPDNAGRASGE